MLELALALALGGDPAVARAEKNAAPAYAEGIDAALLEVDPEGLRPWWRDELWRVCWRESKCGAFGHVGMHAADGWTGAKSHARAVERGRLDPDACPAHSLDERSPAEFATRGGFGQNAARGVGLLGSCVAPEALDDPRVAARLAALTLAGCVVGERECTCSEHTAIWSGAARLASRPLFSWWRKSRFATVRSQCGGSVARAYALAQLLTLPLRLPIWVASLAGR